MNFGCLLLAAVVGWIIFSLVIFPVVVMTAFAIPILFPYIVGAVALYIVWKLIRGKR